MNITNESIRKLVKDLDLKGATIEELVGPNGLVKQLTKRLVEEALEAEMQEHLGYGKGERAEAPRANHRNGTTSKTVKTDTAEVDIDVPRDRNGTFEPQVVKKRQTRLAGFDEKVISLYARGMSTREIQDHLAELYGTTVSPDLISRITAAVMEDVREWRNRPLTAIWPIVYLDALVIRVRDGGTVGRKSAYLAIGINVEGVKEVLGLWLEETEGAKFWLKVMNELKTRGVKDILIACVDGLKGFPEAIEAVFPNTTVQSCIVHMIRNSTRYVAWKQRKAVAAALKPVYTAIDRDAAWAALEAFDAEWGSRYPMIMQSWKTNWEQVVPFLDFPEEVRKILYTTNAIESLNATVRKLIRSKGHFPNDDAALKLLYLALSGAERRWTKSVWNWNQAMNQFAIHFEGRLPV